MKLLKNTFLYKFYIKISIPLQKYHVIISKVSSLQTNSFSHSLSYSPIHSHRHASAMKARTLYRLHNMVHQPCPIFLSPCIHCHTKNKHTSNIETSKYGYDTLLFQISQMFLHYKSSHLWGGILLFSTY